MKITSEFLNPDGSVSFVSYQDSDSFSSLDPTKVKQTYAVCLLDGKMVIVLHGRKNTWGLVGGSIEPGESYEECLAREIKEESNMRMLDCKPIGYQAVKTGDNEIYQLRYACTVEPYGDFLSDPDGNISQIKIINPQDYKQYFDWGEIGDRIVQRALKLL